MAAEGDRTRAILAMVVARASRDAGFRKKLMSSPTTTLRGEGLTLEKGVKWKVLLDTKTVKYVALSRDFRVDPAHAGPLTAVLRKVTPIPDGGELRIVQSTDTTRYLVVPMLPKDVKPGEKIPTEATISPCWSRIGAAMQRSSSMYSASSSANPSSRTRPHTRPSVVNEVIVVRV